jgi:DNA-binding CsgD family transcriptional regulator
VSLIERDEQLACLDRLLACGMTGKGQVALISGAPGTGRTGLLRTFSERAASSGVVLLNATCSRAERALPFGVLSQLFHSTALPAGLMARAARLLAAGNDLGTPTDDDFETVDPRSVRVLHGLCLVLLELAADTPILISVDDIGHADIPSQHCLLHLARRLGSARILTVFTDDVTPPAPASFRAELVRQPSFQRIQVGPLSADGVTAVLTKQFDEATADDLAPQFHAISGGNPLLLNALVDDHRLAAGPCAQGYGMALLSCVHRGDPVVAQVVRALAVLGERSSTAEAGELLTMEPDTVTRAVQSLGTAGLLDHGRFRHPAARAAVLDELTPQDRADLHRRAAKLRHGRGAAAMTVAHHLIQADDSEESWAVDVLLEAGEQARLAHRPRLAADCFKLAFRSSSDADDRAGIRARLARAEWRIDPAAAARHLAPLAEAMRADQLTHRDSIVLVRQLLWHGRMAETVDILNRLREHQSVELRDAELWLTCAYPQLAKRRKEKPTFGTPNADPWLQSAARLAEAMPRELNRETVAMAEQVLRDLHLTRNTSWAEESAMLALLVLVCADKTETAAEWCDQLKTEADIRQASTWQAMFSAARAEIAVRQGDLTGAVRHAHAAMTHMAPKMWGVAIGYPLGSLILACTRMGDFDNAAKHLKLPVDDAMFASRYGLHYRYARGHFKLATGRPQAALADFLECGELMRVWGLDVAGLIPWRSAAAEAHLRMGNADQARRLIYDQLARPGMDGTRARGMALRQLAAASTPNRRPQLLTEALDVFEACGDRFEQARVLADLSREYHGLDENRRARMVVRRAWHMAKMCEAEPLCQELLSVTSDLSAATTNARTTQEITSLTGSERRVASLAVMGYTNREIAAKLYITSSTVEQHLTRVYRKLKVKRRKDLPVDLSHMAHARRPSGQRLGQGGGRAG